MQKRENSLDFLRLFATVSVVVVHATTHFETSFLWLNNDNYLWFYDGVPLFFVLSGFLIYKSCEKTFREGRPLSHYFINRVLRIVPAIYVYLLLTTISFFLLGVLDYNDIGIGLFGWVLSTLFLFPVYFPSIFNDFGIGVVNGSLWTIPAEFSFYLILPLFVFIKQKRNFKFMIMMMALISIISVVFNNFIGALFTEDSEPLWFKVFGVTFLPHLLYFSAGVLLAGTWSKIRHSRLLALTSLLIYILIRYQLLFDTESVYLISELLLVMPFAYFVIWFGFNSPLFLYKFTSKIGDISYGMYIWHMVVINYFIYFGVNDKFNGNITIFLVLIITGILGLLSWWLVEKQALKLKPYSSKSDIKKTA